MNDRKITAASFERGPLSHTLSHEMHHADLSVQGRERVGSAMQAAIAHVARREGLQYGVSGKHLDNALHFLDTHYDARHELKPKERELIESTLRKHYDLPEEEITK